MASHSKRKTTVAKLNREARLRERRAIKEANKQARRQAGGLAAEDASASHLPDLNDPALASGDHSPAVDVSASPEPDPAVTPRDDSDTDA
jgi:hypothetical protein